MKMTILMNQQLSPAASGPIVLFIMQSDFYAKVHNLSVTLMTLLDIYSSGHQSKRVDIGRTSVDIGHIGRHR